MSSISRPTYMYLSGLHLSEGSSRLAQARSRLMVGEGWLEWPKVDQDAKKLTAREWWGNRTLDLANHSSTAPDASLKQTVGHKPVRLCHHLLVRGRSTALSGKSPRCDYH